MSEKYPKRWRDACLKLLQHQRDALCAELGYKRVGWSPIRNRIMKPFDVYENGKLFHEDERLIRQNFDSWEKGAILSDEKFNFIDAYIRKEAIENSSRDAIASLQFERFCRHATVFSELMVAEKSRHGYDWDLSHTPWVAICKFKDGHTYKASFLYGMSTFEGIVRVISGFISKDYDEISDLTKKDVIFYEGSLIPLRSFNNIPSYKSSSYSLKLFNPMWIGHDTFCFLESSIRFGQLLGDKNRVNQDAFIDPFSPPLLNDGPPSELIQNLDGLYGYDKYECLSYMNHARPSDLNTNSYIYVTNNDLFNEIKSFIDKNYIGYVI